MTTDSSFARHRSTRNPLSLRWVVVLLASIMLHLTILNWANGNFSLPFRHQQEVAVITADLRAPPAERKLPVLSAHRQRTAARPRPHPPAAAPVNAIDPALASLDTPGAGSEPAAESPAMDSTEPAATATQEQAETRYKVSPPPSAVLKYDVQALREGQTVYGHGKISWQSDGGNYTVTGEAGVLFFTVLSFKSEGAIDEFGVAPLLYSEKRFRKSETNTHFQRERNVISFSASTISYPRAGGEQDRASIIWQLAGIGRGDQEKFMPNAEIDLFVAGVRDAETWRIHVIGKEDVEVGAGKTVAWHVVRMPRPGSYEQKLDIWLAPEQEWYPVRLRYTETNGDYLDMSLSNLSVASAR